MRFSKLMVAAGIAALVSTTAAFAGAKSVTPGVSAPSRTVASGPVSTQTRPGSGRLTFVLTAPR